MFRAPEANYFHYDKSCDVWSFGIIIGRLCHVERSDVYAFDWINVTVASKTVFHSSLQGLYNPFCTELF